MKHALAVAVLSAALAPAQAQVIVYRCGPDGREYSDTPCKHGQAVDVADPRTDEERRDARKVAERDARLAERLRQERLAAQAQAAGQGAAGLHLAPRRDATASGYENAEQIRQKLKRMEKAAKKTRPRKAKPRRSAAGTSPTAPPSSRRAAD